MVEPGQQESKKSGAKLLIIVAVLGALFFGGLCLLGIVGAIAIPAFVQFQQRSKAAEARPNLRFMMDTVIEHCESDGHLVQGTAGPIPPIPRMTPHQGDFASDPTFAQLGFAPVEALYYSYSIQPTETGVLLLAEGDLDEDGLHSRYSFECSQDCTCTTEMRVENELE